MKAIKINKKRAVRISMLMHKAAASFIIDLRRKVVVIPIRILAIGNMQTGRVTGWRKKSRSDDDLPRHDFIINDFVAHL